MIPHGGQQTRSATPTAALRVAMLLPAPRRAPVLPPRAVPRRLTTRRRARRAVDPRPVAVRADEDVLTAVVVAAAVEAEGPCDRAARPRRPRRACSDRPRWRGVRRRDRRGPPQGVRRCSAGPPPKGPGRLSRAVARRLRRSAQALLAKIGRGWVIVDTLRRHLSEAGVHKASPPQSRTGGRKWGPEPSEFGHPELYAYRERRRRSREDALLIALPSRHAPWHGDTGLASHNRRYPDANSSCPAADHANRKRQ